MVLENFDEYSALGLITVFVLMFAFGSSIDLKQFMNKLKKPKGIAIGVCCQYILLPLIAFAIARMFSKYLLPEQQIGLIIVGTMPGGSLSNFFCFLFGADLALSVAMTTMSSLSSFIFITINGLIYIPIISKDTKLKIDYISLLLSVLTVIIALCCGLFVSYKDYKIIKRILGVLAAFFVVFALAVTLIYNAFSGYPLWKLSWSAWISPLLLTLSGYFIAFTIAKLLKMEKNSCVAVAIECANQNIAFAAAIMVVTLGHSETLDISLGMPILYGLWNYTMIFIVGAIFRKCGYLEIDENDKSMSFAKLMKQWKERNNDEVDLTENAVKNENEDNESTQRTGNVEMDTQV